MTVIAVRYTYDERAAERDVVRPEHRAWLASLAEAGTLLGSGPLPQAQPPGALLVFRAPDVAQVHELLAQDPFARAGLVQDAEILAWELVLGPWSATA
ncbi:YciI family protein [Cellulomonas oligotrophica]|uniref:YCII-related domain-containing protein n=1 Tax=Cellulomonas oligotrophica TaxID=931536 RepID=A0A7Y9FDD0_9CELL|nr:YciI family protein [Cellulomonas oligotrophica]NYD84837.1 hypothetical protein [Cellulomonas oligotrophica]GIG31906.1 hypothetical protein Col01nite_10650 [Cellulomonas oligotrophica]